MRAMNVNSLVAYEKVKPELTKREQEVLTFIKNYPRLTGSEIAQKMGKQYHQISGRFKPLAEKGKIIEAGTKYISNRPNTQWQAVIINSNNQIQLF